MAATQFEVIETVNNNNAEVSETKIKRRKDGNPKWTRSNKQKGVSSLVYPIKNNTFVGENLNPQLDIKRGFLPK